LTPTLVLNEDGSPYLACGTPGGDKQDQWQLAFLIRHLMYGQSMQQAMTHPALDQATGQTLFIHDRLAVL